MAQFIDLAILVSVFLLVLALWLEFVLIWARYRLLRQRRVQDRLLPGQGAEEEQKGPRRLRALRLWRETHKAGPGAKGTRRRRWLLGYFDWLAQEAGWSVPGHALLFGLIGASLLVFVVSFVLTRRVLISALLAAAAPAIALMILQVRIGRRAALFERQLLDALTLMAQSLRAGHPLGGAFRFVSMEVDAPLGQLFEEICQQQALGMSLEQALRATASKTSSPDMQMFAICVAVQLRSGGNLVEMMQRLGSVIRERIGLKRRLRVVTAQARFGRTVIAIVPFGIVLMMHASAPHYLEPLYTTPAGNVMLAAAIAGLVGGLLVMNRMIAAIRY